METKKYFLQPDKQILKQGYTLKDESDNVVYEAKCLKRSLFGGMKFEFFNHLTNSKEEHKIGGTVTVEESGVFEMFSTKSYYKYDGKKIWDYLHDLGVRIDSNIQSGKLGMEYTISLKGNEIAKIKTSSPKGKLLVTTNQCLEVYTDSENLDLVFLVAFSIARTEQAFLD